MLCILLFTLGVIFAAPQNKSLSKIFGIRRRPIRYKYSRSHEPIDLYHKTAKSQRIAADSHLVGSTAHHRSYVAFTHSHPSPYEAAKNQWIGPAVGGGVIGGRVLNNVIDCRVCGKCNAELQDANMEEKIAKVMALVQVMGDINAVKESLNALINKKVSVKDDHIAEAQLNEAVLGKINSIKDALENAGEYLKEAAKNILCH